MCLLRAASYEEGFYIYPTKTQRTQSEDCAIFFVYLVSSWENLVLLILVRKILAFYIADVLFYGSINLLV